MTQPVASTTKLADASNNGQIGPQQGAITVPTDEASNVVAITAIIEALEAHGLIADN